MSFGGTLKVRSKTLATWLLVCKGLLSERLPGQGTKDPTSVHTIHTITNMTYVHMTTVSSSALPQDKLLSDLVALTVLTTRAQRRRYGLDVFSAGSSCLPVGDDCL
jgi:hypothetical protein